MVCYLWREQMFEMCPPFFGKGFRDFCDEYGIRLNLTSPYIPESSGAAERGVGSIKQIMKKTEEEGSCMEEAMSVFRNTRNESGYSPNQLLFCGTGATTTCRT